MRCPDCNKFVAYEESEPEVQDESVSLDDGADTATIEVRIVNACAECSTELKEHNFETEVTLDGDKVEAHKGHDLVLEIENATRDQDSYPKPHEVTDRKTKRKKMKYPNPRYTRTLYGYTASGTVKCETCKTDVQSDIEIADYIEASAMEELT